MLLHHQCADSGSTKPPRVRSRTAPLTAAAGLFLIWTGPAASAATVLFVGNSFTYGELSPVLHFQADTVTDLNGEGVGGVPALFKAFTRQARLDYRVSLETSRGKNLDFHYEQRRSLLDRPWDHVILQGYSTLDEHTPGDPATLIDYAGRLAALFQERNPQVDVRLVATWARADQTYLPTGHWFGKPIESMAADVRAACDQAAANSRAIHAVIPVGQAWNRAMASGVALVNPYEPTPAGRIDLWASDHYHGSTYGYYLEALEIFGSVTGRDPRTLGPHEQAAAALGISPALAVSLQKVAADTLSAEKKLPASPNVTRAGERPQGRTRNVVLIVSDGLRWQEVFQGADPLLLGEKNGGNWVGEQELRKRYWREDPRERRRLLFPFLWGTVAQRGQLFGNRTQGSDAHVTNGVAFSYPGYNEMSVGFPDKTITSNEFGPNPNVSVFEWLNQSPELTGHVAIYGTWSIYADIFNEPRSHLVMQAGWSAPPKSGDASRDALLARLFATTTRFDEEDVDNALLQVALLDYVRTGEARVLFVGYGETDNWAHQGRYDLVLESAHRMDGFVQELWETMQALPQYRDTTTFIITADHGRGSGPTEWKEHGVQQKGSENIWLAVLGPDTPPLGERTHTEPVTEAQIAATIAAFVGKDYRHAVPRAAPAIDAVLGRPTTAVAVQQTAHQ